MMRDRKSIIKEFDGINTMGSLRYILEVMLDIRDILKKKPLKTTH